MTFKIKEHERARVYHSVVSIAEDAFLLECEDDIESKGLPLFSHRVCGPTPPRIPFAQLLMFHAQEMDDEAESGPYGFVATKNGEVVFFSDTPLTKYEALLVDSVREVTFNEDLLHPDAIKENQTIAVGAVVFGYGDNRKDGPLVTVDCHYIDPILR